MIKPYQVGLHGVQHAPGGVGRGWETSEIKVVKARCVAASIRSGGAGRKRCGRSAGWIWCWLDWCCSAVVVLGQRAGRDEQGGLLNEAPRNVASTSQRCQLGVNRRRTWIECIRNHSFDTTLSSTLERVQTSDSSVESTRSNTDDQLVQSTPLKRWSFTVGTVDLL